MQEPVKMLCKL